VTDHSDAIKVARITSRQAIIVALITASVGLATGYFGSQTNTSSDSSAKILELESRVKTLQAELHSAELTIENSHNKLSNLKQRVRDILGPKEDVIRRMSNSLERMKNDPAVSIEHRERLSDITIQLEKIDTKVLSIVE